MSDSLFTELKRRNVIKVAAAYLVLAWLVVQVTATAVPAFAMPEWVNTVVFYFGIIGFPFALFFSWAFEITPEGVKREIDVDRSESIVNQTSRKIDFVIIGLLAVALGYFIYESRFSTESTESTEPTDLSIPKMTATADQSIVRSVDQSVDQPAEQTAKQKPEGSSIAVLPFVNMSSDKEQEYFSDGISEEILNLLAKIPNLKVTSRSSAFSFKGKDLKISDVAEQLNVSNVLEGSVRKSGNKIRITAQLIEAGSDVHLWSETYDRELVDIFTIQDEISAAIVVALKSKLGIEAKLVKRNLALENPEAYSFYLQGKHFLEKRTEEDLTLAMNYFDKAIALKPDYAEAWAFKAMANEFLSERDYGSLPDEVAEAQAKPAAGKALKLAPLLAEAHAVMGLITENRNSSDNDEAISYYQRAIELNPNYSDAYSWYAGALLTKSKKRLALVAKGAQLNPLSIVANGNYGLGLIEYGRLAEAEAIAKHMIKIDNTTFMAYRLMGFIRYNQGKLGEAANFVRIATKLNNTLPNRLSLGTSLAHLNLTDLAAKAIEGTELDVLKYRFKNNIEYFLSEVRAKFPRAENDGFGSYFRGEAEFMDGQYKEAISFLEKTPYCENCSSLILSYQQTGNHEAAAKMLAKKTSAYNREVDSGVQNINWDGADIAFMNGDIELAINRFEKLVDKLGIDSDFSTIPAYKKLWAHPKWPSLMARSDAHIAKQAAIYLQLVADEKAEAKVNAEAETETEAETGL